MASLVRRGILALLGAGWMIGVAACDEPSSLPAAKAAAASPAIFGTYLLDPARSEEYDLSDPCGAPVMSRLVLEGRTWRTESQWAAGCLEGFAPDEPAEFTANGRIELRGDSITLHPTGPGSEAFDVESGNIADGTITLYPHCGGMDVFVRVPAEANARST